MPEINLKDHYPDAHQQACFIEVTQEIFEVMHEMVRREKAHLRQVCRYHAQHSLDNPYAQYVYIDIINGLVHFNAVPYNVKLEQAQYECDVLHFLNDPCDTVEKRWQLTQLGDTFRMLSEKQIKRLIERYHHNKTIEEIAHLEGVTRGSVNESIQAALAKLRENCEIFA